MASCHMFESIRADAQVRNDATGVHSSGGDTHLEQGDDTQCRFFHMNNTR
jgi:hypothetical protein